MGAFNGKFTALIVSICDCKLVNTPLDAFVTAAIAVETKFVVAICVLLSPCVGVIDKGVPVKLGLSMGAFNNNVLLMVLICPDMALTFDVIYPVMVDAFAVTNPLMAELKEDNSASMYDLVATPLLDDGLPITVTSPVVPSIANAFT